MKQLHRPDLFTWSRYDEPLRIDFNGILWRREGGNVLVDPPPLADHDVHHLDALGGAASIVLTTSDHVRAARELSARTGAQLLGPAGERATFPVACAAWLSDGDEPFPGLRVRELGGSKTDGELALVLEETTAIFGDAVRAHHAGALMLLPRQKLRDPARLLESVRRVRALHPRIAHVLVGDGWSAFNDGGALLDALLASSPARGD
ncbi:MAG TPA: MBL fold metallo-hydrolase [Anaeromyxobacter sp.]|nr:MBL fold metallo-hydrolase [Anaeromyxobacter sp.]